MLGSIPNERLQEALNAGSDLARTLLDELAARTADPPGVTRIAYGAGERSTLLTLLTPLPSALDYLTGSNPAVVAKAESL